MEIKMRSTEQVVKYYCGHNGVKKSGTLQVETYQKGQLINSYATIHLVIITMKTLKNLNGKPGSKH